MSMERGMWSREGWRCAGCYDQTLPVACPTAERQNNRQMVRQDRWTGHLKAGPAERLLDREESLVI